VATTLQRFGGALGIAVVTTVFAGNGGLGAPAMFVAGFRPAVATAALISTVSAAAALSIPRRRPVGSTLVVRTQPRLVADRGPSGSPGRRQAAVVGGQRNGAC
jgi:hypothetical protein